MEAKREITARFKTDGSSILFEPREIQRIREFIESANKNATEELEIRFGNFARDSNKFTPGVNIQIFNRLLRAIKKWIAGDSLKKETFETIYENNIRKIENLSERERGLIKRKIVWVRKSKIGNSIDIKDYSIRISLANEEILLETTAQSLATPDKLGKIKFIRIKERESIRFGIFQEEKTNPKTV